MQPHLPTEGEELAPDEVAVGEIVASGDGVNAVPTEGPAVEVGFGAATDEDLEGIPTEDSGFGVATDEDEERIPTVDDEKACAAVPEDTTRVACTPDV